MFRSGFDSPFGHRVAPEEAVIKTFYCTIVDAAYVPRAMALRRSIARHNADALFGFYCIDEAAAALLERYASATTIVVPPREYESDALRAAKPKLKVNEYCWTCKPAVLLHALGSFPGLEWAAWLDADMLAFADLDRELVKHPAASVILTPHRFMLAEFAAYEKQVGRFNAGYVAFQNIPEGIAALKWWMNRCLEGCPAVPTEERFADQKYLNALPSLYENVAISSSLGLNCAPWNVFDRRIEHADGDVTVEGEPLLLYHFQGFKIIRKWVFDLYASPLRLPEAVRDLIYRPYVSALGSQISELAIQFDMPEAGIDHGFKGFIGLLRAAARLRRSSNLLLNF